MEIAPSKHVMAHHITSQWDMIIAFPPCTYMTNAGACRMYPQKGVIDQDRLKKGLEAKEFFMKFYEADCDKIAIENPRPLNIIGLPKETQRIQPWMFGEPFTKMTYLWLKGLPELKPTEIVKENIMPFVNAGSFSSNGQRRKKTGIKTTAIDRSKTFTGIAKAMAEQWSELVERKVKSMNLYELTADYLKLQSMLEDPDVDQQAVADTMEAMDYAIEEKADGYVRVIKNMQGSVDAFKLEIDRLTEKKRHLEDSIKRLKTNLQESMVATGKRKIKTDLFQISIQKNGGAIPVIVDVPVEQLPDECVIITEAPDKKALAALLQDPENKDHYSQYAHFGDRGESLRIK